LGKKAKNHENKMHLETQKHSLDKEAIFRCWYPRSQWKLDPRWAKST